MAGKISYDEVDARVYRNLETSIFLSSLQCRIALTLTTSSQRGRAGKIGLACGAWTDQQKASVDGSSNYGQGPLLERGSAYQLPGHCVVGILSPCPNL